MLISATESVNFAFSPKPVAIIIALFLACGPIDYSIAQPFAAPEEGDYLIKDFKLEEGGVIPNLKLHYRTIGNPERGNNGRISNAILILHSTAGSGESFLVESFSHELFAPGKVLDATKYYIVLPDSIGHGQSSRPSDGARMDFPSYTYKDMVLAQHRLLSEHLQVDHLKLVMGTSMGGMHTWMWGYMFPQFMDALLPLASTPVEIAGRNRMLRKMIMNLIMNDPTWKSGLYDEQPEGFKYAMYPLIFMISSPIQYHLSAPTREGAEAFLSDISEKYASLLDANDLIYQFEASRHYDPSPHLEEIEAPVLAINSADDEVNPPELGVVEREIKRVRNGRYILLPVSEETNGHATYLTASLWSEYLKELMQSSEDKQVQQP